MRPKLQQMRAIRKAVPEPLDGIGYGMPGYKLHGKPMLYFAGFKEHYSLFASSGTFLVTLEDELRGYDLRKGRSICHLRNRFRSSSSAGSQSCVRVGSPEKTGAGLRAGFHPARTNWYVHPLRSEWWRFPYSGGHPAARKQKWLLRRRRIHAVSRFITQPLAPVPCRLSFVCFHKRFTY
jgi:hypothetical protein